MSSEASLVADAPPADTQPASLPSSPLGVRDFRVYWIGQLVSLVGMWAQMVAQAWVITDLTNNARVFGWLSFLSSLPMGILLLPAGVVADRMDRRKILVATQILLAGIAFAYAALVHSGHLTLVYVFVLASLVGCIGAFDFPAQQALVPQLVPAPLIPKAIGLNQAIFHGSRFLGPVLAAGLLMIDKAAAFVINGVSYFAVVYSLLIIPSRPKVVMKKDAGGMGEAFRYLGQHKVVMSLIGLTALATIFVMPVNMVFMPLLARNVFHATELQFGIIMCASGLGAVVGSVSMMRVPAERRGRVIVGASAMASTGVLLISAVSSPYLAALALLVTSLSTALAFGLSATTITMIVPNELRGRVMGIYGMTFVAVMPVFALLWGYVADLTSLHVLLVTLGVGFGVTSMALLLSTGIWAMKPPVPPTVVPRPA
jgi:MFS family permease